MCEYFVVPFLRFGFFRFGLPLPFLLNGSLEYLVELPVGFARCFMLNGYHAFSSLGLLVIRHLKGVVWKVLGAPAETTNDFGNSLERDDWVVGPFHPFRW